MTKEFIVCMQQLMVIAASEYDVGFDSIQSIRQALTQLERGFKEEAEQAKSGIEAFLAEERKLGEGIAILMITNEQKMNRTNYREFCFRTLEPIHNKFNDLYENSPDRLPGSLDQYKDDLRQDEAAFIQWIKRKPQPGKYMIGNFTSFFIIYAPKI